MIFYILFENINLFNAFNILLRPIWKDDRGNIRIPFVEAADLDGTMKNQEYSSPIMHPSNNKCLCFLDEKITNFALVNEEVATIIATQTINKQEAKAMGWFNQPL